jgi:hypothetical protein
MCSRVKIHTRKRGFVTFLSIGLVVLLIVTSCRQRSPLYPSYEDLIKHGFYVYSLPEAETQERQWKEVISIWGYRFHCQFNEAPNNLYVRYVDAQDQVKIELIMGPWSEVWDWTQKTTEVQLNTTIAKTGNAIFYNITADYVALLFEDQFGTQVQIWSNYPITETLAMIQQLEYIGPTSDTMHNPWDCSRR